MLASVSSWTGFGLLFLPCGRRRRFWGVLPPRRLGGFTSSVSSGFLGLMSHPLRRGWISRYLGGMVVGDEESISRVGEGFL